MLFLQGADDVAGVKQEENQKANKHARVTRCKEIIATHTPAHAGLNRVSGKVRPGFPESARHSTSERVTL